MLLYIIRRLLISIPTLLVIIVLCFLLMHAAPGGPFTSERPLPPEVLANIEAKYGLDKPLIVQMWSYIVGLVTELDFGPSFVFKDRDVNDIISSGLPVTLVYGGLAFLFASIIGIILGVMAAVRHNSWLDYFAIGFSFSAQVLPNFVMAPLLVIIFTLWLGWLPGGGWEGGKIQYLILPVIALATSYIASIARIMRSSMLEILHSNFIRTARAKGLPVHRIIFSHALKPALLPVISYLAPVFVAMITGSVIIDVYFSTGGIGQFFVNAALSRDYSVMLGITIMYGSMVIMFNLLADILYAWIDPRIRY